MAKVRFKTTRGEMVEIDPATVTGVYGVQPQRVTNIEHGRPPRMDAIQGSEYEVFGRLRDEGDYDGRMPPPPPPSRAEVLRKHRSYRNR